MSEDSLKSKTIKGVGWTAVDSILRYGVSFFVGIVLARLLSPDEYGLIGILTIFITIFEIIIDGGFINALIRKKNVTELDYCTVFWVNFCMSIIMAVIIFLSSDLISSFFEREELSNLTKVMSVIVIINALSLVQKARLTKKIDFKTQTKVSFISAIGSGAFGILMALSGYGVWALVGQQISNSLINTISYWLINRWIPRFRFSFLSFLEMWNFGWKLLVSGLLNNISGQMTHAIIGKCFSPATLGQYTRGNQFGLLFSSNITSVVQRVSFPVLSEIQDDKVRLKDAYKRLIRITVFPTFILMMTLAACAKPLLVVLIGEKWVEAAYFLQIMSFSLMLNPLHTLNLNSIQVMGRSDLTLRINIMKNVLVVIPIVIGFFTGIYCMLIAEVMRGFVCYYLNAYYSKPLLNYPIEEQLKDVWPSLKTSLQIAIPIYIISYIPFSYLGVLVAQIVVFVLICVTLYYKSESYEVIALKEAISQILKKR